MSGIYIHIPFCKKACHYCNFHFSTSLRYKNEFISALLKEIKLQQHLFQGESIETIYFGGGTPSLLAKEEIRMVLQEIRAFFPVMPSAEITLEANPDDITHEKIKDWQEAGINRLSIGVQSFFEEDLVWMNRAHNAKQAIDSLKMAIKSFENITIDLIYGTPELTNGKWEQNLEKAGLLRIPHLSCYALTVEPKTPLQKRIQQKKEPDIDPEKQSEQFLLLMQWAEKTGYEHYEISNFAKPGFRSRHNSSYWQGKKYLGLGPSAHSFDGNSRWWNIANNNSYIRSIENGIVPFEKETLTELQKLNEYIMISLRTSDGLDLSRLKGMEAENMMAKSRKYIQKGQMKRQNQVLQLTRQGKLFADGITADLFFI
ncbi:MAG: radical SAM family heme chaperone HemW [Chitinophagaceae bacterium]